MELLSVGGVGLILGFRHAFEPDHLAAVSTLAAGEHGARSAARLGAAWGLGHSLAVGAAVLLLIVLDIRLPDAVHRAAEVLVAFLLVALGVWTFARRQQRHPAPPLRSLRQSFGFGLVHGLAGSGSIVVLVAAAAASHPARLASFLLFGLGTIAGMLVASLAVSQVAGSAGVHSPRWATAVRLTAAAASIAVGLWLGWETLSG